MSTINRVQLDAKQEKLWSDTRAALIWHCPAFSHIFYTMLQNAGKGRDAIFTDSAAIPIAATDGSNLIFNVGPEGFFRFNLNQRLFIVAHEILHCILNHCGISANLKTRGKVMFSDGQELPYDGGQMNEAEDYVINAILTESKVGQFPTDKDGKQLGLYDANIATSASNSLDTYRKIFKKAPQGGGKGKGDGKGKPGFDEHLAPGTSTGQDTQTATNSRNKAQWDTELQAGLSAARAMGKLPAELDRALSAILEAQVDWREKIQALFARKVGSGSYNWSRPDRALITRNIYAPGRSGFGAGTVVVGIDTSGSIGGGELDMFMAEMAGILEDVRPKELVLMWCDAKVHRVDYAEEASDLNTIRAKGAPGGGGTSFGPVFDEIARLGLEPEALVYLTDGMGSFPRHEPKYHVIWGNIYKGSKYPWGDVVDIPKQVKR
jgi:predicted metal-dependent peptidase